ncbi:MAG: hypothetical protein H7Z12_15585 [Rhodospirillaceae bacterium]|nr:hypothetical protein [Rhodospirillales bacterium]
MPLMRWFGASCLVFLAVQGLVVWQDILPYGHGALFDADCYTRLLKVQQLLDGGGWFDAKVTALNAPYGLDMHWTRPFDILLLVLMAPLALGGDSQALWHAGLVVSPLLGLATIAVLYRGLAGIIGGPAFLLSMVFFSLQRGIVQVFTFGRPDHHSLLLFALAAAFSLLVGVVSGRKDKVMVPLGLTATLAVWVNPEGLLLVLVCLLVLGLRAIIQGGAAARQLTAFALVMAAGILVALAVERPAAEWLMVEYDRLSAFHAAIALVTLAVAVAGERLGGPRLVAYGAAACVGAVVLRLTFPDFFHGPFASVGPWGKRMVLDKVTELQPLWPNNPVAIFNALMDLDGLPAAVLATGFLAWRARGPLRAVALVNGAGLAVFIPSAAHVLREAPSVQLFFVVPMALLVMAVFAWARQARPVAAAGAAVATLLLVAGGDVGAATIHALHWQGLRLVTERNCDYSGLKAALDADGAGPDTLVMAFPLDDVGAVAWTTGRRSSGGPYHRDEMGIGDAMTLYGDEAPDANAQGVAARRGARYVAVCRTMAVEKVSPSRLLVRLYRGRTPDWLERLDMPGGDPRVAAYRVR